RGLEQHPGAPRFLTLVGTHAHRQQMHELDVHVLQLLEAALSEPVIAASVAEAHRVTWTQHRNEVRRDLPAASLPTLEDERLDQLARLTYHHAALAKDLGVLPLDREEVGLRMGMGLIALGREQEGRARLAALEPEDPLELAAWIRLARAWAEMGRTQEVERIHGRILRAREILTREKRFADYQGWEPSLSNFWPEIGHHLETAGRLVEAYDLLREVGSFEPAQSLLFRRDLVDALIERYGAELRVSIRALPPAPAVAATLDLERLYDLGLKLTEVQIMGGHFDGAVDTYSALLELLPVDQEFFAAAVRAAKEADRTAATLDFLRRKVRAARGGGGPRPDDWDPSRLLEPMPVWAQRWITSGSLSGTLTGPGLVTVITPGQIQATTYRIHTRLAPGQLTGRLVPGAAPNLGQDFHDRLQILTLELELGLAQEAHAQVSLADLRSMAAGFQPAEIQEFGQLVLSNTILGDCLELVKILRACDPTSVPLLAQHTRLLVGLGRFDEAEAELAAFPEPLRARATITRRRKQIATQKRWRAAVDALDSDG
ncbi:MAG: hypothetical protein V3T22_05800, partial [Planctomycetota bacterium]